ncbi:unnamed protein product, partial [Amoebophrya sp. A25]
FSYFLRVFLIFSIFKGTNCYTRNSTSLWSQITATQGILLPSGLVKTTTPAFIDVSPIVLVPSQRYRHPHPLYF